MPTKKKLLFITGTRADYGKLEPLAKAATEEGFNITFFITGMHMMKRYGETRLEVRRFKGAEFFEVVNQRENDELDLVLAKTVLGFSDFVHEHKPDLVVIHGDRTEALAASIVCAMRNIRSAHIEGGEVSGTIDESIRHCNTKLCTSHFVSSEKAKTRVLGLGERPESVFVIGSPELDNHSKPSGVSLGEVQKYYDIPFNDYGVAIFHPVTSERESISDQVVSLFTALESSEKNFLVISPNNDPGTQEIFDVLERLPSSHFKIIPSMRFKYFSELLKNAKVVVGNSSVGVREAPFLGLPSLDIGSRQSDRALSESVHSCTAYDQEAILRFIKRTWGRKFEKSESYGDGSSTTRFIEVLHSQHFWKLPIQKVFFEIKAGTS